MSRGRWKLIDDAVEAEALAQKLQNKMALNTQPQDQQAEAQPEEPSKTTLHDLPAEMRVEIYEFAVSHDEGGGIISPIGVQHQKDGIVLKEGIRFLIRDGTANAYVEHDMTSPKGGKWAQGKLNRLPNCTKQHFCTFKCLIPPPLTRVSKLVRLESLSAFYGVNKFHFELCNLIKDQKKLAAWWRTIEDMKLRWIRSLNFHTAMTIRRVDSLSRSIVPTLPSLDELEIGVMYRYRRFATGRHLTERVKDKAVRDVKDTDQVASSMRNLFPSLSEETMERNMRLACEVMAKDGLHVKGLETVLLMLQPRWSSYLPDLRSLEGPQYVEVEEEEEEGSGVPEDYGVGEAVEMFDA